MEHLLEQTPLNPINRSAAKSPSLPGALGSPDRFARFTARGTSPEAGLQELNLPD